MQVKILQFDAGEKAWTRVSLTCQKEKQPEREFVRKLLFFAHHCRTMNRARELVETAVQLEMCCFVKIAAEEMATSNAPETRVKVEVKLLLNDRCLLSPEINLSSF